MNKYVIDVTQLVHWSGNLTGIPRVMDELASRFLQDDTKETVFVSWVRELGQMCEVDFAKTRPHRGDGIDYVTKNKTVSQKNHNTPITAQAALASPTRLARKVVKKIAVKSRFDRTPLYKKALSTKRSIELQSYKPYTPRDGDKFFIPWGEWWDQNWLSLVKSYALTGVQVYPICHDILPMVVPQFSGNSSSLAEFVKQVFPVSARVLAVSESTKSDLTNWMQTHDLAVPHIDVFRLGENFTFPKVITNDKIAQKYDIEKEKYIVYVSTIEPRKNHNLLYYVYKLAKSRDIQLPKLLIIGRVGHDVDKLIKKIATDPEVNQKITICNNVDDAELNWLYQNCLFAVAPSFYEGWGMPVLESIARGKSVVCSNTSSLLEMPKDCVIFFNPASTDECLAAITKMMQPDVLKKHRAAAKKYKLHSWDDSYNQVIKLLKER